MDNICWANDNFNWVFFGVEATRKETYPDNIVFHYDPTFPVPNDPPPDPNGTTGHFTQDYPWQQMMIYPRWVDWDAYDFSSSDYYSGTGVVPKTNFEYSNGLLPSVNMSYRFTVTNFDSIVRNEENNYDEYYPFECAETIFENQAIIKFYPASAPYCPTGFCWNDGTVIRGKIAFSSIDVTCTPIPEPGQSEYGYNGFKANTGSTFSPHSEADWEVTVEDGGMYGPPIDIPQEDNMIVFVNDFWVTEVIPPGG